MGYAGVADPREDHPHPDDDGIFRLDLESGAADRICSFDRVARYPPTPDMANEHHRFEHLVLNPSGNRMFFLHRWPRYGGGRPFHDRLLTVNTDGSDLRLLLHSPMVSHFDWRDDSHIVAWAELPGRDRYFWVLRDAEEALNEAVILGEGQLDRDGHSSFSPDRRWLLTDTYPHDGGLQRVIVYDTHRLLRHDLAAIPTPTLAATSCVVRPAIVTALAGGGKKRSVTSGHELAEVDVIYTLGATDHLLEKSLIFRPKLKERHVLHAVSTERFKVLAAAVPRTAASRGKSRPDSGPCSRAPWTPFAVASNRRSSTDSTPSRMRSCSTCWCHLADGPRPQTARRRGDS